ncbi:hypothetical protein LINPERPRIM_LOCUS5350 [Linum perenne]
MEVRGHFIFIEKLSLFYNPYLFQPSIFKTLITIN